MPILRVMNRGMDREMYESMRAWMDIEHRHPLGMIMQGAIEVDGVMQVAQIWESEEYATRFDVERLQPAIEAFGAPEHVESTVFELTHLVTP